MKLQGRIANVLLVLVGVVAAPGSTFATSENPVVSYYEGATAASPIGKMYWTSQDPVSGAGKIQRANLDGTGTEDLLTGLGSPSSIAIDVADGKMYWTDQDTESVHRATLDGNNVEGLVATGFPNPLGIALDLVGGRVYWGNSGACCPLVPGMIQRADLDGTNVEDLRASFPGDLALDLAGGKMYYTAPPGSSIFRVNLDGSDREQFPDVGDFPLSVALDIAGGKMYYSLASRAIRRATLDGSAIEDLVAVVTRDIALDLDRGKMYWTNNTSSKIQRANLDGSDVEDLVTAGMTAPFGITLDLPAGVGGIAELPEAAGAALGLSEQSGSGAGAFVGVAVVAGAAVALGAAAWHARRRAA